MQFSKAEISPRCWSGYVWMEIPLNTTTSWHYCTNWYRRELKTQEGDCPALSSTPRMIQRKWSSIGYDNAKELLEQEYGNPYSIMSMYRKEIKAWPQLKNGDRGSFQNFYNFLVKCEIITKSNEWNPLDTPYLICLLLSKLRGKIRNKWIWAVMDARKGALGDFIKLIHEETMLVNDSRVIY